MPVQTAFVQIVRRPIGGGDHHHAQIKQLAEQAAQDHGIGDIAHFEFIETEQPGSLGDIAGDGRQGIIAVSVFGRCLAEFIYAAVHFAHELVEMYPPLAFNGRAVKEQIHQHRLAPADIAIDVQPLGRRLLLGTAKQELPPALLLARVILIQAVMQHLQLFGRQFLGRIRVQRAAAAQRVVALQG